MKALQQRTLVGSLYGWPPHDRESLPIWDQIPDTESQPAVLTDWRVLVLRSHQPLADEVDTEAQVYRYPYLIRESGHHADLVSIQGQLVPALLRHANLERSSFNPQVFVDRLVDDFTAQPHDHYSVSRIYARVDGYGH